MDGHAHAERRAAVRTALDAAPAPDETERLASLLRLVADPTRVRILLALLAADELCVHELAEVADASESTASHALRLLRTAGVVRNRRDGRTIHYRLDDDHVRALLELSLAHVRHDGSSDRGGPDHG